MTIAHKKQEKHYSCAAACAGMVLGVEEKEARKLCKTKYTGTKFNNLLLGLKEKGLRAKKIEINNDYKAVLIHLNLLSDNYPVLMSCKFISRYNQKGRDNVRHHAVLISKRMVYDPGESFEAPSDAVEHSFNKNLYVKQIIIVGID